MFAVKCLDTNGAGSLGRIQYTAVHPNTQLNSIETSTVLGGRKEEKLGGEER